jgi:hypothetical protein
MVYVFDDGYNFLYKKALKQTQGSTFAEEKYTLFTLSNGNIIFQTTYSVGDYSPSIQSYAYDYISNGKCYKLDSYLLDIRSGNYAEIEIPYILKTVLRVDVSDTNSLPYGAQNIAAGQKIDGKKLVTTGGATYGSFLLFNSGKTSGMPSVDGSANITVVNENRFFVENDFSERVGEFLPFIKHCSYIEDSFEDTYCYPSAIEVGDGILVAYYHSNGSGAELSSGKITKITFEEIEKELTR